MAISFPRLLFAVDCQLTHIPACGFAYSMQSIALHSCRRLRRAIASKAYSICGMSVVDLETFRLNAGWSLLRADVNPFT